MHLKNSALLAAFLFVTGSVSALDLTFPVNFPKFSGMDATITVNGQEVNIRVRVAPDEKGKYACIAAGCTVDGNEVVAKAKLSPKPNPAGGFFYFFKGSLKSPKGTPKETKVKLTITGEITTGVATFKYSGPAGKDTLTDHPANILADLGFSLGSVSISPEFLKPGKFVGSGTITTGLGNDTIENGPLKMTVTPCKLVISLKVGKKKFIFKAEYLEAVWVGKLTVVAKPFKTKDNLSIPAEGELAPPVPCGVDIPSPGKCSESSEQAVQGMPFSQITLYNETETFDYGTGSFIDTPAGNVYGFFGFQVGETYYFADHNCLELNRAPTEPGPWVCISDDVGISDLDTGKWTPLGALCFELDTVFPRLGGTWVLSTRGGGTEVSGRWESESPVCGFESGEALLGAQLQSDSSSVGGQFDLFPTSNGGISGFGSLQSVMGNLNIRGECITVDLTQATPGPFFSLGLFSFDFLSGKEVDRGRIDFSLVTPGEVPDGTWDAYDVSDVSFASGTWAADPRIVCGFEQETVFGGQMTNGNLSGNFSVSTTSKQRHAAFFSLFGGGNSYQGEAGCLDLNLTETATGVFLTIPATTFDSDSGQQVDAGRVDFAVTTPFPFGAGDWTLYDPAGGETASGAWDFDQFTVCGNQQTFENTIEFKNDQDNFIGSLNLGMTDKGFDYVNLGITIDTLTYSTNNQCLDIEVGKADVGPWFTVELTRFDQDLRKQVQVGTISLEIDSVSSGREGIWSAKDLDEIQFGSGRFAELVND